MNDCIISHIHEGNKTRSGPCGLTWIDDYSNFENRTTTLIGSNACVSKMGSSTYIVEATRELTTGFLLKYRKA